MKTTMVRDLNWLVAAVALVIGAGCTSSNDAAVNVDALTAEVISAATTPGTLLCAPTPAQIAACTEKAAGDACTLAGTDGKTYAGTCRAAIDGSAIGCVPNPRSPPSEAIAACVGKGEGEACNKGDADAGESEPGICTTPPGGTELACRHYRAPPQVAIDVCVGKAAGDVCNVPNYNGPGYKAGVCSLGPTGAGPLACEISHGLQVEATAACMGLEVGAACSFGVPGRGKGHYKGRGKGHEHHGDVVTGMCVTPADDSAAICFASCSALGRPIGICGGGKGFAHGDDDDKDD